MTYHASNFTVQNNHLAAEGGPPCRSAFPLQIQNLSDGFVADGTALVVPLTNSLQGLCESGPMFYERIEAVDVVVENDNGTRYACRARKYANEWEIVSSVAGDVGVFSNNNQDAIRQPDNPWRRPWGQLCFDGNALAAFDDGASYVPEDLIEGVVWLHNDVDGMGLSRFSEFTNIPPDSAVNQAVTLDSLNRAFRNGTGRVNLGTRSDGGITYAHNCDLALMPGNRRIFLRASDIGNQAEQIPASILDNTPGHFRFFPGAFFRRTSYVRNLAATPRGPDTLSIIEPVSDWQPYQLTTVLRAPTKSAWRILVDGTVWEVWVDHPVGSDYRTALEIWNNVWGPIVQQNEAVLNARAIPGMWTRESVPGAGYQAALMHRLQYLQFAELLALTDGQSALTEDYIQNNTSQID